MIALAVDSSNTRGMGHLFRSLLLVKYLKEKRIEFLYLINNDSRSKEILEQHGIDYSVVDYSDKSNWEEKIIREKQIDIWINDLFETSVPMAKNIKNTGIFLALIDDIGAGEKYADIVFIGLISFSKKQFCRASIAT